MSDHRRSEPARSLPARIAVIAASTAAVLGLAVTAAGAAPKGGAPKGNANGHLILTVGGDVVLTAGPGKAIKAALAACATAGSDVLVADLDADDVRAVFPAPLEVCEGVTLTSKIPLDVDEAAV
jgi:hypothetical protein